MIPPKIISGWKIADLLGEGKCGGVYEATRDDLKGAAKIVQHKKPRKREVNMVNLLANESNLLSRTRSLHIPYLPRLYQKYTVEDQWSIIVMERLVKGSLCDYVKKWGTIPSCCVFGIGWRLIKCLQALHTAGWFHLDLKPANVMIAEDPVRGIVLIDFGLALPTRYTKLEPRAHLEGTYPFLGSHAWNLEPESSRDDLEAVGITLAWVLLGGRLPWSGEVETEDVKRRIQDPNMPSKLARACGSSVLEEYLTRVRNLDRDEDPRYDELLGLMANAAGDCVKCLDFMCVSKGSPPTTRIPKFAFPVSPKKIAHMKRNPSVQTNIRKKQKVSTK